MGTAPTFSMVKKWFIEFCDAERSGRPKGVTPEFVGKIHAMILDDRKIKIRELNDAVDVPSEQCTGEHLCSLSGKTP